MRPRELRDGDVLLLENVRFHPSETANDPGLRGGAGRSSPSVYVNDAFGAAHRAHASTEGVAHLLPAAAGLLLRRELEALGGLARMRPRALRRDRRRRQGGRQDRRARVARGERRRDPDRRRHGLHVPRPPRLRGRRFAARGRGRPGRGAARARGLRCARLRARAAGRRRRRARVLGRHRGRRAAVRRDPAGLDGPRHRARRARPPTPAHRRGAHRVLERPDGRVRARAVRGRHAGRRARRSPPAPGDDRGRRRRLRRGRHAGGPGRPRSTTSRPAAAPGSSCSRATSSPASPPFRPEEP